MTIPDAIKTIVSQRGKSIYNDIWGFAKMLRTLAPLPEASKKEVNIIRIGIDKNVLNLFVDDNLSVESRLEKIKIYLDNLGLSHDAILYLIETFGMPLGYEEYINNFKSSNIIVEIKHTDTHSQLFDMEEIILNDDALKQLGYKDKTTITHIEIPTTFSTYSGAIYKIVAIGNGIFENCTSLRKVVIPTTVDDINIDAFKGCTSLEEITIPDNLKFIGESAFANCTSLSKIVLPTCINGIMARTFCGCTSLKTITIPNNVKFIGESAFEDCISLKNIELPNTIKKITKRTFYGCKSLTNLRIPDSVIDIETLAFCNCESLNNLVIPQNVRSLGCSLFINCKNLTSITVPVQFLRENLIEQDTSTDLNSFGADYVIPSDTVEKLSQDKLMKLNQELYQNYRKNTMTKQDLMNKFRDEILNIMSVQDTNSTQIN